MGLGVQSARSDSRARGGVGIGKHWNANRLPGGSCVMLERD